MNDDKTKLTGLLKKLEEVDKRNIKLYLKMNRVLNILEDDSTSSSVGLVSRVNELEEMVSKLMVMNVALKRVSVFFITVAGGVATFIINHFLTNKH